MSLGGFGRDMLAEAARIAQQTVAHEGTHLRWATVTEVDPLRIRYDGEPNPSIVTPQNTVANLNIGDRVQIAKQHGQAVVVGRAGGVIYPFTSGVFTASVDTANTPKLHTVTLPSGLFTAQPDVVLTPNASIPDYVDVSMFARTSSSFDFYIQRKNTAPTPVFWVAVQS